MWLTNWDNQIPQVTETKLGYRPISIAHLYNYKLNNHLSHAFNYKLSVIIIYFPIIIIPLLFTFHH